MSVFWTNFLLYFLALSVKKVAQESVLVHFRLFQQSCLVLQLEYCTGLPQIYLAEWKSFGVFVFQIWLVEYMVWSYVSNGQTYLLHLVSFNSVFENLSLFNNKYAEIEQIILILDFWKYGIWVKSYTRPCSILRLVAF